MIKKIISKTPEIISRPIISIYSYLPDTVKYGLYFRKKYKFLQKSQWWNEEQHKEYQLKKVKEILKYSYENVNYYKRIFDENNIKLEDIKELQDLKRIPYLTKEIITTNLDELVSKEYSKRKIQYITTGGSTGIPMGFYQGKYRECKNEWAFITNLWSRVGYDITKSHKTVSLRGNILKSGVFENKGNNLTLSSFNLIEENIKDYIKKIQDFQPEYIQAYPSSIYLLSKYMVENNIELHLKNFKAIICGSENLYDFQRKIIEAAFKSKLYSFYGHTEHSCLAGECEKNNYYHLQSEYGFTELINKAGCEALEENEAAEIVCTGFNNYVVPFIRYRTGDIAINTNEKCECGRSYKLIKKIDGREQDFFIDKEGSKITITCSDDALYKVKDKIFMYQYVQNVPGKVVLKIQEKYKFNEQDKNYVIDDFKSYYPRFDIDLDFKTPIERTKIGKLRYLIQNIKP